MDRVSNVYPLSTTQEILQALAEIGECERIKHLLKKDFEGTMQKLEETIPSRCVTDIIISTTEHPEALIKAINTIRAVVDALLRENTNQDALLRETAKKLVRAMDINTISETSMLLASQYLNIFFDIHRPIKMKEWEKLEEDLNDFYLEEQFEKKYTTTTSETKEVTQKQIETLNRCIRVITLYLENLEILIFHIDISSELRKRGIADEKNRILLARNICNTVRKAVEFSANYQPYHDLCYPNNPFEQAVDIIIAWEDIFKEIRQFQK